MAKAVTLHVVDVLGDNGSGSAFGITNSMDWVGRKAIRPTVASMTWGGGFSQALNDALDSIVEAGILVVTQILAASRQETHHSLNLGATNPADKHAVFSSYGNCTKIWVLAAMCFLLSPRATPTARSTAAPQWHAPHVSGAAALLLSASPSLTPEQVLSAVVAAATPDVVKDADDRQPQFADVLISMSQARSNRSITIRTIAAS